MEVHQGAQFSLNVCYTFPLETKIAVLVPLALLLFTIRWFVCRGLSRWELSPGIVLLPLLVALTATSFSFMRLIAWMEEPRGLPWNIYAGAGAEMLVALAIGGWCSILGAAAGVIGTARRRRTGPPQASGDPALARRLFGLIVIALAGLVSIGLIMAARIGYAPLSVDPAWGLPLARCLFCAFLLLTVGLAVLLVMARRRRLGDERRGARACLAFVVTGVSVGLFVFGVHLLISDLALFSRPW